jgi:exonuclease SbcD
MRVLHTADWHLNDRLGRVKRQSDIVARLEEIANYLDDYSVEVMIVAGDIFSDYMRLDELQSAFGDVHKIFRPFLRRGGTILGISGNHDSEHLFRLLRSALDMANPVDEQRRDRPTGRLYLASNPSIITLPDKNDQLVQFVLMPYPRVERYLQDEATRYSSIEEKNQRLHHAFTERLNTLRDSRLTPNFNPQYQSVLVSHIHVRGSVVRENSRYHLSETEDVMFDAGDIPTNWTYVAYGHIHRAQTLLNTSHIRYAGGIERFDAGEKDDLKSVVLFDIGEKGLLSEPTELPLDATPIYHIEIDDPIAQLPTFGDLYPDRERALVAYKLIYKADQGYNRDEVNQALEAIFPRWYQRQIDMGDTSLAPIEHSSGLTLHDVPGTVRSYLNSRLVDDPDKDDLISLAEELLANRGGN